MIQVVFFVFFSGVVSTHSFEPYYAPLGSTVWGYFTPPVLKTPQRKQTPMEAMVDLTNNLGVAILQDHSHSSGNFAFSPYGMASVLVVMYEGARGESAHQIHRAVGFPSDKDVLRMGFRDIHRHLRSYFSHEGFLSGISLSKNGSNLTPGFKKLLKYYGYDVDLNLQLDDEPTDDKPSTQKNEPTDSAVTTTPQPSNEKPTTTTETVDEKMDKKNKTDDSGVKKPEESTTTEKQEGNEIPTTVLPTTKGTSTGYGSESKESTTVTLKEEVAQTTLMTTIQETMTASGKDDGNDMRTTNLPYSATEDVNELKEPTIVTLSSEGVSTTTESTTGTTDQTTMVTSEQTTESITEEPTTTKANKETEMLTVFPGDAEKNSPEFDKKEKKFQKSLKSNEKEAKCKEGGQFERRTENEILCDLKQKQDESTEPETQAGVPEDKTESEGVKLDNGMLIPQPGEESTGEKKATSGSTFLHFGTETEGSQKRSEEEISLQESSDQKSSEEADKAPTSRPLKPNRENWNKELRKMFDSKTSIWAEERPKKRKRLNLERWRRTIVDYLKWPLNPDLSLQLQNGMYDTHVSRNADTYRSLPRLMFLVDGAIDTPVPMMTYTSVFSYGYVPQLHAKALEFPLDDIRYKLLIVLPVVRRGLKQLIYDLSDFPVRDVLTCLRPTRVKAAIPTFMVEGFVILTSSLQRLGIRDVFDPRKANLSGMSVDPELYVRNVEQSVTVVIKNYVEILDIQTRTTAARYLEQEFEATHPFVYFVLDTATNVALMVGQMLDPLNSRIY